ncbi:AAA family ATPase [Serinicoccus sp. CNJ-927]|uniref:AAA family ATPase n=1 Tax=Serinicoccus sp. CNJ-927 TaxID=1904970 RepID=UPI00096ACBD3|nr:AAA family ATPase [Serinicoccus sp. CNJ-927]
MLVALRVENFKSIRRAKVRFGELTCVVGHNGVGKSNLFDAIHFLSLLAEKDVYAATIEVRRTGDGSYAALDLVHGRDPEKIIQLSADMIASPDVVDDFGQESKPSTTLLTYTVALRYDSMSDRLLVSRESLTHAKLGDFRSFTEFPCSTAFKNSVAIGSRRGGPLISTDDARGAIVLHGDGGSRGRPAPAGTSPLTVVGGTNTVDYPTVLAAKREMASWRLLHLEPSAMRSPDSRGAEPHVSASGGRLAATLNALVGKDSNVALEIVNRLNELNSHVRQLEVFQDAARDQLVLRARVPGFENWMFGRSLSDGTLRYIALALMLADASERGALCLEEPENGIHPSRIPNLVALLQDYAVDLEEAVADDNPLRQVILNSHSPEVARQISPNDLLFAEHLRGPGGDTQSIFRPLRGTWRANADPDEVLLAKDPHSVADFIGGSPLRAEFQQMEMHFGTAQ